MIGVSKTPIREGKKKSWKNAALDIPWGTGNQDGATSNLALLDHLKDNRGGLSSLLLANKALRRGSGLETRGIDAESTDVRMRGDEVQTAKVLGLGNGHYGLIHGGELVKETNNAFEGKKSKLTAAIVKNDDVVGAAVGSRQD